MFSAYHLQTDGQVEFVNRCLETYLRCMVGKRPKEWVLWVYVVEWWYNAHQHSVIGTIRYQVVCGQPPSLHVPYVTANSRVEAIDRCLRTREDSIKMLDFHLERAQNRMKVQPDKKGQQRSRRLEIWCMLSYNFKYFGPFPMINRIEQVAYKLLLPLTSKVHPAFHISN